MLPVLQNTLKFLLAPWALAIDTLQFSLKSRKNANDGFVTVAVTTPPVTSVVTTSPVTTSTATNTVTAESDASSGNSDEGGETENLQS